MKNFKKIVGINLLVLLLINLVSYGSTLVNNTSVIELLAMPIVAQVLINFILALIFFSIKKHEEGRSFLLSMAIVLLIGFSTCFGVATLL